MQTRRKGRGRCGLMGQIGSSDQWCMYVHTHVAYIHILLTLVYSLSRQQLTVVVYVCNCVCRNCTQLITTVSASLSPQPLICQAVGGLGSSGTHHYHPFLVQATIRCISRCVVYWLICVCVLCEVPGIHPPSVCLLDEVSLYQSPRLPVHPLCVQYGSSEECISPWLHQS